MVAGLLVTQAAAVSRRDEYFFKPKNRRKIYGLTEKN